MAAKKKKTTEPSTFAPEKHEIVSKHEKLSKDEAKKVLERYHATIYSLPKISVFDPVIIPLGASAGDIIKISRKSYTAGETVFYRGVVDE